MMQVYKGRITEKACDSKQHCYVELEYTDEAGVFQRQRAYFGAEKLEVGDLVRFTVEERETGFPRVSVQPLLFGCVVNRAGGLAWIKTHEDKQYVCREPIEAGACFVSFYEELPEGGDGRPCAVDVTVKTMPAALSESDEEEGERQSGVVIDHCWGKFITVQGKRRFRFYCDDYAVEKWFFKGDKVSFETQPNRENATFIDAVSLKKKVAAGGQHADISSLCHALCAAGEEIAVPFAADRFPNDFQKQILGFTERFRQQARRVLGVWSPETITFSSWQSREQVFTNITGELHPSDEYYTTPLARFKPFFDPLVPYLYACELMEKPASTAAVLQDYCGFLSDVRRAQQYGDTTRVQVDANGYFDRMLACLLRRFVIRAGASLDAETAADLLLALRGKPCWQEADTDALLAACGADALAECYRQGVGADDACLRRLAALSPRALGKCCDLILHRGETATALDEGAMRLLSAVLAHGGSEAIFSFMTVERSQNDILLQQAYEGLMATAAAEGEDGTRAAALAAYLVACGLRGKAEESTLTLAAEQYSLDAIRADADERGRFADRVIAEFCKNGIARWTIEVDALQAAGALMPVLYASTRQPDGRFDARLAACVMLLYIKGGDKLRARMLYSLFIRHRSITLQPLFARIRPRLGKDKQFEYVYDVLFYAFTTLSPSRLIEFLRWAEPLYPSPQTGRFNCDLTARTLLAQHGKQSGAQKQTHTTVKVYDYYFMQILKGPGKQKPWEEFIRWILANHHDSNAINRHMVCVCEIVSRMLFKERSYTNLQPHLSALLRSDAQSGRIKENLIYLACEHIRQCEDKDTARMLLLALYRGAMTLPKTTWPAELLTFCEYCQAMLEETQDSLYADLLVRMRRRRLTPEEIERLLPYLSDKSCVCDALVDAYQSGKDLRTVERLLTSLRNGEGAPYRERCLRAVWESVVFNSDRRGYEYLSDEEFDSLRQACVEVLGSYYAPKKLKEYVHGEASLAFKMLLCAQFVGIYDERVAGDLFAKNTPDAAALCEDTTLLRAYLLLSERQCLAQLQQNTGYDAFYKYRRYLKLLIIAAIQGEEAHTDALIEANDHRAIAEEYNYAAFKTELLPQLMAGMAEEPRRRTELLLALLTENVQPYFQAYAAQPYPADPLLPGTVKKMIRHLDFRTVNSRFFVQNVEDMANGQYEGVMQQAMLLSDEMYEIVSYLAAHHNLSLLHAVKRAFERHDVSEVCMDICNACRTKSEEEQGLWASVICAKQLPFKVVNGIRYRIISERENGAEETPTFDFELDVIYRYHSDESKGYYVARMRDCEHYLWCLRNYLRGDYAPGRAASPRRLAEQIERARSEIEPLRLPREWQSEAKRFLAGDWQEEGFAPDRINISHWTGAAERFAFVEAMLPLFAEGEEPEDLASALEICQDDTLDSEVRIGAGLLALRACGRAEGAERAYRQLAVCVGQLLIESDAAGIDAGSRLSVFLELAARYDNDDRILGWLPEFCNELTVEDWLVSYRELQAVLSDAFRSSYEYCAAIWQALEARGVLSLDRESCSMADLLCALAVRCEVSDDAYIDCVRAAARRRYEELNRYRLAVQLEGISACDAQTAYAYFTVVNEGCEVIHLEKRIQLRKDQKSSGVGVEVGLVDLRPGWLTGCRYRIDWGEEQQATLSVTIKGEEEGSLPLYRAAWVVERPAAILPDGPRPTHELYEAARAVGRHEALFGRAREEREILASLEKQGFAIITGPSRIGKTSLMNRLFTLAKEQGNVLTLSFADASHDEGDYEYAFYDTGKRVEQVASYLLSDGLCYGLDPRYQRVTAPATADLATLHRDIRAMLQEDSVARKDQYSAINRYLGERSLELWVMLDEFQQIIEKNPSAEDMRQIKEVLSAVYHAEERRVKFVFCGSDTLHKAIGSTESGWRDVLSAGYAYSTMPNWIRVGAIADQDFYRMLSHKTLSYTKEAMMAAAAYAANIPLYGKQICNHAIKQRRAQPTQDDGVLYCYDIATAVEKCFENEAVGMIKAVIKGLSELDVLCLSYVARSLQQGGSPADAWRDLRAICGSAGLQAMTEYLQNARLLLKDNGTGVCDFSSAFFYNAFCCHAKGWELPAILDRITGCVSGTQDQPISELLARVGNMDEDQQARVLRGFKADALADAVWNNETARRELRERIRSVDDGQNLYTTYNNYGQIIEHQEVHVRIDKQIITTLLTGDPNSEDYAKFLSALRRENYLDEATKREVGRLQDRIALLQSPEADEETQAEIATLEEQIEEKTAPAGAELVKDVLASVPIDEWLKIDDACWMRLLGIDEAELSRVKSLDAYLTSLNFAILIHNVLNGIYENIGRSEPGPERDARLSDFDFSPVSILYCKVVEAMLNREHMPLFQQCFPDFVYDPNKGKTFGEWTTADKPLEIGKFHYVLTDPDKHVRAARRQLLANASGVNEKKWSQHTTALNTVRPIRNNTAHDITPMHHNEFEKLIKTLFPDGELLLIWDLAHGCT